jgi:malonate transporter and related proteins
LSAILITVLPVFGMIVLGYGFARANIIDVTSGKGLGLFVFNVAIPALLFRTTSTVDLKDAAPWSLWLSFFGGLAATWILTAFVSRSIPSLNFSGGASASMASGFGNLAMLGTPLALAHFGQGVAVPLGLILSIHSPVLWTAATLHREIGRHSGNVSWVALAKELFNNLSRNAIVIALLAGAIWRFTGLGLHPIPDKMLSMLADASIPTALFALGTSLAAYSLRGAFDGMFVLLFLKMLVMPIFVFISSHYVFALPPLWAKLAVMFAAMPTGANAFLFAQRNDEGAAAVSGSVAAGTALSAISLSLILYFCDLGLI